MVLNNKKKFTYYSIKIRSTYFFCFVSKNTKKREYLNYQKSYEKFYGKPCEFSYKRFWMIMLRRSIIRWLWCFLLPIILIISIFIPGLFVDFVYILVGRQEKQILNRHKEISVNDELQKSLDEKKLESF